MSDHDAQSERKPSNDQSERKPSNDQSDSGSASNALLSGIRFLPIPNVGVVDRVTGRICTVGEARHKAERERLICRLALCFAVPVSVLSEAVTSFSNAKIEDEYFRASKGVTEFRDGVIVAR